MLRRATGDICLDPEAKSMNVPAPPSTRRRPASAAAPRRLSKRPPACSPSGAFTAPPRKTSPTCSASGRRAFTTISPPKKPRSNWSACKGVEGFFEAGKGIAARARYGAGTLVFIDQFASVAADRPRQFRQGLPQRAPASAGRKPAPHRPLVARAGARVRRGHQGRRGQRRIPRRSRIRAWRRLPFSACAMQHQVGSARKTSTWPQIATEFARLVIGGVGKRSPNGTPQLRPRARLLIGGCRI